jgi:hypothetical protein
MMDGERCLILDVGCWILDYRFWIMDYGLWIMDYGLFFKFIYISVIVEMIKIFLPKQI